MLTQNQGQAYVVQLRAYLQSALNQALATKTNSESGYLHKALVFLGVGSDSAVDAVPGDLRMELAQVDSLEASLPDAVADDSDTGSKAASWLDLAATLEANAAADLNDQQHATLKGILEDTGNQTAADVRNVVTRVTNGLSGFIPTWMYIAVGGVAVLAIAWRFLPEEEVERVIP